MALPSMQFTREIKLSIFIGICLCIFFLGLFSRTEHAIGANQCKMTYTSMDHKLIPVKSDIQGPLLYKYSNALNKKLNKQPVLFIPGHQGRYANFFLLHILSYPILPSELLHSAIVFCMLSPSFPSFTLFFYPINLFYSYFSLSLVVLLFVPFLLFLVLLFLVVCYFHVCFLLVLIKCVPCLRPCTTMMISFNTLRWIFMPRILRIMEVDTSSSPYMYPIHTLPPVSYTHILPFSLFHLYPIHTLSPQLHLTHPPTCILHTRSLSSYIHTHSS